MQYREIGKSGIQASTVALGAWAIGGWMWGGQDDSDSIRTIQTAIDQGINLIDTAAIYGFGHSEEVVGRAIAGRRQEVVLATKCGLRWEGSEPRQGDFYFSSNAKGLEESSDAAYQVYRYLGPDSIREEIEASLRRLNVETIDLYQTHWQETTTAIEDTMDALVRLREEGKIRAIGVSNANVEQIQKYLARGTVDSDQEQYSMLDRKLESSNLPFCRKRKISFLAYSPLANGLLTGKIGADREFGEGDLRRSHPRFSLENRKRVDSMLDELRPIAGGRNVTLAQLVIAWTLAQPGVTHALVGARNNEQALANAAAGDLELTREEVESIARILARHAPSIR
jgi:aryl-alcohol dehydrogenase-like predicted oxidoreductase